MSTVLTATLVVAVTTLTYRYGPAAALVRALPPVFRPRYTPALAGADCRTTGWWHLMLRLRPPRRTEPLRPPPRNPRTDQRNRRQRDARVAPVVPSSL